MKQSGHLKAMHIVESSACSCEFVNEDEFHFFFGCPLFNRPRIILQNVISSVAPFTLRTLLYGVDEFDCTENKKIINETLKYMKQSGLSDVMHQLSCDRHYVSAF